MHATATKRPISTSTILSVEHHGTTRKYRVHGGSRAVHTCSLSAPAHESILLMRSTWKGCARMRMWKLSFPANLDMYLFADTRAASRASEVNCSFSSDTFIRGHSGDNTYTAMSHCGNEQHNTSTATLAHGGQRHTSTSTTTKNNIQRIS